jgi:hypothetical protein
MKTRYYTGNGTVAGKMWGGGVGAYPSKHYSSDTIEGLREQITKDFESGALDSGFGFERLVAAKVDLIEEATIEVNGREFISNQIVETFELGDKEYVEFLDTVEF